MMSPGNISDQLVEAVKDGNLALIQSLYGQLNVPRDALKEIAEQAAEDGQSKVLE